MEKIGEQHHFAGKGGIVIVDGPVRRRVLEQTYGAFEEVHHRYLFAPVRTPINQRTGPVRCEHLLHQRYFDDRVRCFGKLPYPHLNFLCSDKHRLLELAQQKLLLDSLTDARVQSSYPEAFGCGQPGETISERLLT